MDAKSPSQQNYYRILNIATTASADEIRKAISRELRLWSNRTNAPDIARRQEAERMVRFLGEAETILLDEAKRKTYDRELSAEPSGQREFSDRELEGEGDLVAEAWRLLTNGEVPDALYVATKATEKDGHNPQAWAVLAQAKFRWGDTEDAIYEYKRAIKLKPNEASYYFDLGSVYESLDRAGDALQQYQRAAQIDPKTTMYRAAVGVMLLKTDKLDQGTEILERCSKEEPENASYQWFLALAYTNDAYRNWIFIPPGDERGIPSGHYATKKEHVTRAQALIAKAEKMKFNDLELSKHIRAVHADIDKMMVRRFHGSIVTPIVGGLIWAYLFYGVGLLLAPLYFWVSRPPQYALNARALRGDGGPATAITWEAGTGFVENVAGGLFTAAIYGLFLPVMVIWNFVKFRTGDNDLGEFNFAPKTASYTPSAPAAPSDSPVESSNHDSSPAPEKAVTASETNTPSGGPLHGDAPSDTTSSHTGNSNAEAPTDTASIAQPVFPDIGAKVSLLLATPEGQRNVLLVAVAVLVVGGGIYWLSSSRTATVSDSAATSSVGPAAIIQVYATRPAVVRNMPTTMGSQAIARLSRGDVIQGSWVTGSDGIHQWLKIASAPYQGDYVSNVNLSTTPRPTVANLVDRDMKLQQQAQLLESPAAGAVVVETQEAGSVVHVAAEIDGGWMEIERRFGGVGYVPAQAFSAPQIANVFLTEPAQPVPQNRAILAQGIEHLRQTWTYDFEGGIEPPRIQDADIFLESEDGSRERTGFNPENGAQVGLAKAAGFDYNTCAESPMSDAELPLASVSEGTYVCVRTRHGHLSEFRVEKIDGDGHTPPFVVTLEYRAWN